MNASVEIEQLTRAQEREYDEFVRAQPQGLFYHTLAFRDFLLDLLECRANYLVARQDSRMVGAFPIMVKDSPRGPVVNSLPFFGSNGGPIASNTAVAAALDAAVRGFVEEIDARAATVIEGPHPGHFVPQVGGTYSDARIGCLTLLARGADLDSTLFPKIESRARRAIRKAEKSDVVIGIENDALPDLRGLHESNMATVGGRPKPSGFYRSWRRCLHAGRDWDLYIARVHDKVVSGLLVGHHAYTDEYYMPAVNHEYRELQPNAAVVYRAMQDSLAAGRTWWNWGGTWEMQEGVYRFKKQWDPVETRYEYHVNVRDAALTRCTPVEVQEEYPYFYVAPFSALQQGAPIA